MDQGGSTSPVKPVMDVLPPAAATPASRPVITDHQPLQPDPMMTARPSLIDSPAAAATPVPAQVQAPITPVQTTFQQPALEPAMNGRKVDGHEIADPLHKLTHAEPFYGHVGKHKKNKLTILFMLLVLAAAAASYFYLFKAI